MLNRTTTSSQMTFFMTTGRSLCYFVILLTSNFVFSDAELRPKRQSNSGNYNYNYGSSSQDNFRNYYEPSNTNQQRQRFEDRNQNYNSYNERGGYEDSFRDNINKGYQQPNFYDPNYDHYQNMFRLEELNPYEFNDVSTARKTRRPNEYKETAQRTPVNVDTSYGKVSGYHIFMYDGYDVPIEDRPNQQAFDKIHRNVTVFKGIPYAQPPIDDLRFKPPRTLSKNWGYIDGRKYGPVCPQPAEYIGLSKGHLLVNEDCLYLNIYTPSLKKGLTELYPVMIYIHGGFFNHGSANRFPAHMLSAATEVVVVTFNYRLGVLGFLSTADDVSPGNYGLLDQAMAINWVSNNIQQFNGDASRVTLFGPGAGAASAGLHMLSPRTKNSFHRVIAQSGSMLAEWAVTLDPEFSRNTTRLYGEKVGCNTKSSHSLVSCLRSRKPAELVNANLKPMVGWLPFTPVVDHYNQERNEDVFLEDAPERLLEGGFAVNRNIQYMCGLTTHEATLMILNDKDIKFEKYDINQKKFDNRIRQYIDMYNYTLNPDGVYNAIKFMYTPWSDPNNKTLIRDNYIQMLTDSYFAAPVVKLNQLLLKSSINPYMYVLNTSIDSWERPDWHGVPHDTEYLYITGAPFMDHEFYPSDMKLNGFKWTEQDRNMSHFIMTSWTNFAKYGSPNKRSNPFSILWEHMTDGNLQYLSLNTTNNTFSVMQRDYKEREAAFWTEYIPQLIGRILPTWAPTEEPWVEERKVIKAALWGTVAAAALFLILLIVCCALYCGKKRQPAYMDEDQLPHYNAPYIVGTEVGKKKYFSDEVTINHNAVKKEQQTSV